MFGMVSRKSGAVCALALACVATVTGAVAEPREPAGAHRFDASIERLSQAHGVPERLIRRVIMRESRYAPHLTNRGHYGLMQIKLGTAQGMGYRGTAAGLLDGETNLTYAVPYLANAWAAADQSEDRAVQLYAGGYYYVAKRKGLLQQLRTARSQPLAEPTVVAYAQEAPQPQAPAEASSPFAALFGQQPASAPAAPVEPETVAEEFEMIPVPRKFASAPLPPARPPEL